LNLQTWPSRKKWVMIGLLLLVAASASSGTSSALEIKFLTHSVGDQTFVDAEGELRGKEHGGRRAFNVELVREMMQVVGHTKNMAVIPFKRGFSLVQTTPGHAIFNVNRTGDREDTVKWVGPLQSTVTHFYENVNAPVGIKNLEEAKQVESICVLRGNVHHRALERQGFTNIYPANSYASCVRMLALGRVSLTPLSNLSTLTEAETPIAMAIQKTPVKVMEAEGYLVFSKETPDEVIAEWQTALDGIKESGRYDELVKLYLGDE